MELDIQRFADGKVVIQTELDTKNFKNGLDRMQNSAKGAGTSIKSIVAGLGITKLISMGFNAIRNSMDDAITRLDTLNNFPKVMSNLGVSTKDAEASIKKMSDKLAGLPTTLDQGASAVQRFTSKNGDVKKSTNIFLALNNAILAGGAPTEMQATALEQLSQAYAKGKPDMMEWRSAMSAMPAQLKQVAVAMGYVNADELGEALRTGKVSMDEFMEKITELNTKGANGFKSFEEQARNSTGGIRTSITVAKTQIVKGVADIIQGLNKGLKKAKLGSLSQIIANIGKAFKKELDKVASMLSKIDFRKVINAFKTLAPAIMGVVSALVAYRVAVLAVKAIHFAGLVVEVTKAFLLMVGVLKNAVVAQQALNIVQSASPVGLIVAGTAALVGMLVAYKALNPETDKNVLATKKLKEEYKNLKQELEQNSKQRKQNIEDVYNETQNAQFLLAKLEALNGVENKSNYQKQEMARLVAQLNELMPDLNLQYDQETDKLNKSTKAIRDNIDAMKEYNLVKAYQKNLTSIAGDIAKTEVDLANATKVHEKNERKYQEARKERIRLENKANDDARHFSGEDMKRLQKATEQERKYYYLKDESIKQVNKYKDELKKLNNQYDNTAKMAEKASDKFDFKKIVAKAEEAGMNIPKKFKENMEKGFYSVPQSLDQLQTLINFDKALSNAGLSGKQIPKSISEGVMSGQLSIQDAIAQANNWISFQEALKKAGISGKNIPQKVKEGILSGRLTPNQAIQIMIDNMGKKLFDGGKKSGENFGQGFINGMDKKLGAVGLAASRLGATAVASLAQSIKEGSPSKITRQSGNFFGEGFILGIADMLRSTLKTVDNYGSSVVKQFEKSTDMTSSINKMQKQMQSAVNLQQGKMSTNIQTGKVFNNLVATTPVNIDLDASIEMDKQKVGRMVTPEVSRTIKTGGGV